MTFPAHYRVDNHFNFEFQAGFDRVVVTSWMYFPLPDNSERTLKSIHICHRFISGKVTKAFGGQNIHVRWVGECELMWIGRKNSIKLTARF